MATQAHRWLLALRLKTLPASIAPILVASALAYADDQLIIWAAICSFICATALKVLVDFANDLFDGLGGIDTDERLGPTRVIHSGLVTPDEMKQGMWVAAAVALLSGLPLIWLAGWPLLLIGLLCFVAALAYSGGPWPLASHGLGEVAVFLFFGLAAITGGYYVHTQAITPLSLLLAFVGGLPVCAIMLVNNFRDHPTDLAVGKHTLVVKLGEQNAIILYSSMLILPMLLGWAGSLMWSLPIWAALALSILLPEAIRLIRFITHKRGKVLNELLAQTARYSLFVALAVSIPLFCS